MKSGKTIKDSSSLLADWDYDRNAPLMPDQVSLYSSKNVWWKCGQGHIWEATPANRSNTPVWWKCSLGHSWKISPNHRNRGSDCPYCANKKVLEGFNDLKTLLPEDAELWDYEKNGLLTPEMVTPYSHRKVWWKCKNGHSWYSHISNRTLHKRGCPYCAGQKAITGENDLATLNPKLALEWDYERNGLLRPENVMPNSSKKVWWLCSKGHSWRAAVYSRKNNGCPVCSGRQTVPGLNDLGTVMPELAKEWDYEKNGDLLPENVACQSNRSVWWKCNKGHSWKAKPCERYRGNGCPKCDGRIKMRTHFV